MDLNNKNIESSIKKDENTSLYELILPGIKRYFEGIIIYKETKNTYGKFDKILIENNLFMDNKVFALSSFFEYKIACFIDLKSMQSNYFFFIKAEIFNFIVDGKKYFCFVYLDYKGQILFYSDYKGEDFNISIKNKKIIIKNNIFGTEVFNKKINYLFLLKRSISNVNDDKYNINNNNLNNKNEDIFLKDIINIEKNNSDIENNSINNDNLRENNNIKYIDIADFYIFDDYFTKTKGLEDFYDFISVFSGKSLKINDNLSLKIDIKEYEDIFMPKFKINLSISTIDINEIDLYEFRKLLFSFLTKNSLSYVINNDNIKKYFSNYILDINNSNKLNLDLNYNIPDNIYNTDIKFIEFKRNILILRYNYFKLKESIDEMKKINKDDNNINIKFSISRGDLVENNMEKTLVLYEQKLKEIFILINR